MLGWLKKKGQDSRIYMCIKEVKWELETADQIKRARILAIASALRNYCFSAGEIPIDVLDRPLDYSRNDLMLFYEYIETIRNNVVQIPHTKKMLGKFGMELPAFVEDHAKMTRKALEVWMSTIGSGIATERRDDVRDIWKFLAQSKPFINEAMDQIVDNERTTLKMTGQTDEDGVFVNYDRDEWESACEFVPSQFVTINKKELHLNLDRIDFLMGYLQKYALMNKSEVVACLNNELLLGIPSNMPDPERRNFPDPSNKNLGVSFNCDDLENPHRVCQQIIITGYEDLANLLIIGTASGPGTLHFTVSPESNARPIPTLSRAVQEQIWKLPGWEVHNISRSYKYLTKKV